MKLKIFTVFPKLLLAVSAVLAISAVFAVSAQNTVQAAVSAPAPLEVGIGVTEITPPLSYPMAGYYSKRLSDGVLDPLMLRAFCFKQGDEMCVLAISDSIYVYDDVTAEVKRRIQEKTGFVPFRDVKIELLHNDTVIWECDYSKAFLELYKKEGIDLPLEPEIQVALPELREGDRLILQLTATTHTDRTMVTILDDLTVTIP